MDKLIKSQGYRQQLSGWITWMVLAHHIASSAGYTIGSVSPFRGTQQIKASVIFVDLDHPAACDGHISRLQFCYHAINLGGFGSNGAVYSANVQIWRELEPNSREWNLIHEYTLRQDTSQDPQNAFVCRSKILSQSDYITVNRNDVIGVTLPGFTMQPLQLISTGTAGFGLYSRPLSAVRLTKVEKSTLTLEPDFVLHLYANIETDNRTTSSVGFAQSPTVQSPSASRLIPHTTVQHSSAMSSSRRHSPSKTSTSVQSFQSHSSATTSNSLMNSPIPTHTAVHTTYTTSTSLDLMHSLSASSLTSTELTSAHSLSSSATSQTSSLMQTPSATRLTEQTSLQTTPSQSQPTIRTPSFGNQVSSTASSIFSAPDSHSYTQSASFHVMSALSSTDSKSLSSDLVQSTSGSQHTVISVPTATPHLTDTATTSTETFNATRSTSPATQLPPSEDPPAEDGFMSTVIAGIVTFVLFVATLASCTLIGCVILVHYRRRVYLVASTGERSEVDAMSMKDISPSSSLDKSSNKGLVVSNIHGHFIGELTTTVGNRPLILPINLETDSLGLSSSSSVSDGRGSGNTVIVVPPSTNNGQTTNSESVPPPPVLSSKGSDDGSNSSQGYMQMASFIHHPSSNQLASISKNTDLDNGARAQPRVIVQNAATSQSPPMAAKGQDRPTHYNDYDEPTSHRKKESAVLMYQNGFMKANRRSARASRGHQPQPMRSRASTVAGPQIRRAVPSSKTKDYEVPISNLSQAPLKRALSVNTSTLSHHPPLHKSKSVRSPPHRHHDQATVARYQNGTMVKVSKADDRLQFKKCTCKINNIPGNGLLKPGSGFFKRSTEEVDSSCSESYSTMDGPYRKPPVEEHKILGLLNEVNAKHISLKSIRIPPRELFGHYGYQTVRTSWRKTQEQTLDVCLKASYTDEEADPSERIKMLQEAAVLAQFRHPNVVRLHGIIYKENVVMLVIEQFPKEDLKSFLEQMGRSIIPPDTPKLLLSFSQQVALGMQYLASKGFVHKDLAARNVFVTSNDVCKVGELWKSEELSTLQESDLLDKVFVKWTAPEAMYRRRYSIVSDVWSYGCLLYEIWSLGRAPFKNSSNREVIEKVDSGYRLPPPPGCPRCIYSLMIKCWNPQPLSRPPFKEILNVLLQDEKITLQIPVKDAATHDAAILLGSQLEASKYMYTDLQRAYILTSNATTGASNDADVSPQNGMRSPRKRANYDHISGEKFLTTFPTSSADIEHVYRGKNGSLNGATVTSPNSIRTLPPCSSSSSAVSPTRTKDLALAVIPSHQKVLLEDTLDSDYEEIIDTR